MVKVSVIVPIYNQEKFLASCLTSLMWQRLDDLEFVRYGSLKDLDFSLLSSRARLDWFYLYQDYVRREQDAQKKCKFLKKRE